MVDAGFKLWWRWSQFSPIYTVAEGREVSSSLTRTLLKWKGEGIAGFNRPHSVPGSCIDASLARMLTSNLNASVFWYLMEPVFFKRWTQRTLKSGHFKEL